MTPKVRAFAQWLGLANGLYALGAVGASVVGGAVSAAAASARGVSPAYLAAIGVGAAMVILASGAAVLRTVIGAMAPK